MARRFLFYCTWNWVLLILLIAPVPLAAQDNCVPVTGEPLLLGAIFPTDSIFSAEANSAYQGAEAMRQAVNACGGVDGHPVEFILEDASDYEDAVVAVESLIARDIGLIVGGGLPAITQGAAAAIGDRAIYWELTGSIELNQSQVFSPTATDAQLGEAAQDYLASQPFMSIMAGEPIRAALIHDTGQRGNAVAMGIARDHVVLNVAYENRLEDVEGLAREMKRLGVNIVLISAFERDAINLWFAVRQVDLALRAWVQIGSDSYLGRLCEFGLSGDAVITVNRAGLTSETYREQALGEVYNAYGAAYLRLYGVQPDVQADLSASGIYMLLRGVLPQMRGDLSVQSLYNRLGGFTTDIRGMFGESASFDDGIGISWEPSFVISQQQGGNLCSLSPTEGATCTSILSSPSWRERTLQESNGLTCNADV
jgi:ABC-type branched-subunit amino acid transport system substrate-binding protein